ncbi:hypothetical protein B0H17DRAFT_591279 [Mycena rosella]|uniref:Uncharacterized protein n=1 Tax=Mycena rosella TaxID=1033263 RepID=A0AAD7DFB5_MYCRO|nr:hypothetical protein B0H17DRAFT_591279 [Mycena rosella]
MKNVLPPIPAPSKTRDIAERDAQLIQMVRIWCNGTPRSCPRPLGGVQHHCQGPLGGGRPKRTPYWGKRRYAVRDVRRSIPPCWRTNRRRCLRDIRSWLRPGGVEE